MAKLSIIIPFVNEYPQVAFTVQSVLNEVKNLDAEVVVINNFCEEVTKQAPTEIFCPLCMQTFRQQRTQDNGGTLLQKIAEDKDMPKLKYLEYKEKLSHWNAKNYGVQHSTGDTLLFLDAHVVPSPGIIKAQFEYYTTHYSELNGTLHLPLAYLLAPEKRALIYRLDVNPEKGFYHYQFSGYKRADKPYRVPCMSTCGMMMSRELYNLIGGWPKALGIYGGGENFVNFVLAILGKEKWIMPGDLLWHYADKRGYNWNYDDFICNRTIAVYLAAGEEAAHRFVKNCQGNQAILEQIWQKAINSTREHKKLIESKQQLAISAWLEKMKKDGLWDGKLSDKQWVS